MSVAGGVEVRARPVSGLWALVARLRGEVGASSDSLSSAGSDRSAASFAYVAPPAPRARPPAAPPSPASDTYRRRVRERSLRRHHDRDLTLHRKYGLYRCEGYDAFSLPPARRGLEPGEERERRAASECAQRRAAHVPGKRRAPPPPATLPATLTRRHARKRPAPQPPVKLTDKTKEATQTLQHTKTDILLQMDSKSDRDRRPRSTADCSMDCKSEKYSKKEKNSKEKPRAEKSFLKQIFDSRKRNSTVETVPIKILPNISELDKQAAEIIALRASLTHNNSTDCSMLRKGDSWFCTKCLRKYNSTVTACLYCLSTQKNSVNGQVISSEKVANKGSDIYTQTEKETSSKVVASTSRISGIGVEEKQKLKEMLKDLKDSLPKRPKHETSQVINNKSAYIPTLESSEENIIAIETPTLRIGSTIQDDVKLTTVSEPSSSKQLSGDSAVKKTVSNENKTIAVSLTETAKETDAIIGGKPIEVIKKPIPSNNVKTEPVSESYIVTQHVVLMAPLRKDNVQRSSNSYNSEPSNAVNKILNNANSTKVNKAGDNSETPKEHLSAAASEKRNLHTPLKISSLLNPVYVPKNFTSADQSLRTQFFSQVEAKTPTSQTQLQIKAISPIKTSNELTSPSLILGSAAKPQLSTTQAKQEKATQPSEKRQSSPKARTPTKDTQKAESSKAKPFLQSDKKIPVKISTSTSTANTPFPSEELNNSNIIKLTVNQHSRRRELVNKLEQSIAKGDELAAAEAASKLAQLRLACSVLSFSSQIAADTSKITPTSDENKSKAAHTASKVNASVQSMVSLLPKKENCNQTTVDKEDKAAPTKSEVKETKPSSSHEITSQRLVPPTTDCSPSTSRGALGTKDENGDLISIEVWVEDREATRGPVRLLVPRGAALGELRRRAQAALALPARLQRWIVGRALCTDDDAPLAALAGPDLAAPFYLCLVESETKTETASQVICEPAAAARAPGAPEEAGDVYTELVQLERRALLPTAEPFECGVCLLQCAPAAGAVLRECLHTFCRDCLSELVRHCEEPAVPCPAPACRGTLQQREVRALVPAAQYERWLARGLAAAESGARGAFHCRTRDCTGWALCEPPVTKFPCPVCKRTNCVSCQAIHEGATCEQHRASIQATAATPDTDEGTQVLLDSLMTKGEALQCPECSAIITKKWGCDWVKCCACKTEICWVTRGRRWGPGGRGDTSAGCRCGVDGQRCHPSCGYCH